jgi:CRP-like cAMP-binding protein
VVIGASVFWDYLAGHPAASLLLRTLADRFGEPGPNGIRIGLRFTQEELAGWTGSSREAVVKALRRLRARGCIVTKRMTVVITDLDLLRRYCR